MISFSPTFAIWSRCIITPFEHVHQVWEHFDMFGSAKLFKLGKGWKWFWEGLMMFSWSSRHEALQDHQICHMWHARIFLELMKKISFTNISKAWKIQKRVWGIWPIFWTWPCVEILIYGKSMSAEFPWFFSNIFEALK